MVCVGYFSSCRIVKLTCHEIVKELRQCVNQYEKVSLPPGGSRGCNEIFKIAGDGQESQKLFKGLDNNLKLQDLQNSKPYK